MLIVPLSLAAVFAGIFAARISEKPVLPKPYSLGETAQQEVIAPKKFAVVDPAETDIRRQSEAAKIPAVIRFQKNIADQSVANFSTEFIFGREKFLDAVEKTFKKRIVTTNEIATARFRKLVTAIRNETKFPVNAEQAARWARGDSEENLHKELCEKLRQISERFIRPDVLPSFTNTFQVRVYESNAAQPQMSLGMLKIESQLMRRTNFVALTKARAALLASFPKEQRALGRALTNFVSPNCFFDEELTRIARAEKTNLIWAVNSYERGQVIVHRGEIVDAKIKAALDDLKIQKPIAIVGTAREKKIWLWSAAIFFALSAVIIGLLGFALRPRAGLIRAENILALPRAGTDLETRLIPHLARGLMNKFVRQIIWQRSRLIEAQSSGTEQLNHLEEQLEQINTRLQTRQIAYEKRIAELERELAAAEEENRELIRAKIREARQNLEWAKSQANGGR